MKKTHNGRIHQPINPLFIHPNHRKIMINYSFGFFLAFCSMSTHGGMVATPPPDALRQLLQKEMDGNGEEMPILLPCCYDGLSARLIARAGFKATFMTGFGVSGKRDQFAVRVQVHFVNLYLAFITHLSLNLRVLPRQTNSILMLRCTSDYPHREHKYSFPPSSICENSNAILL